MKTKGLSPVIASVFLVLLVVVLVGIVWATYKGIVEENLNEAESCLETISKIEIVGKYTCYDPATLQFQFSIEKKDIKIDGLLVSLGSIGGTKNFNLDNSSQNIVGLRIYREDYNIIMPKKNSAVTYIVNLTKVNFSAPDEIKIVPIVNDKQCEVVDSLSEFDTCVIPPEPEGEDNPL